LLSTNIMTLNTSGTAIAVDALGHAFVTGNTYSGFPTTAGRTKPPSAAVSATPS